MMGGFALDQLSAPENDPVKRYKPNSNPAPVAFWDTARRGFDDAIKTRNTGARKLRYDEAMWGRTYQLDQALGEKVPIPKSLTDNFTTTRDYPLADFFSAPRDAISSLFLGRKLLDDEAYAKEMQRLEAAHPEAFKAIPTYGQLKAGLDNEFNQIRAEADRSAQEHPVAAFLGQTGGGMLDPINIVATTATGGLGAGRSLVTRMLTQGAANMGAEATTIPGRMSDAQKYGGPEYRAQDAALDITTAGVGGAGFEAVGDVAKFGWKSASRYWRGRLKDLPTKDDVMRGALAHLDQIEVDEKIAGTGDSGHFDQARGAMTRGEAMPVPQLERDVSQMFQGDASTPVNLRQPSSAGITSSVDYQGRLIHSGSFDPLELQVDPKTFQFKADGDTAGVTARLKGIQSWDPTASGKVMVWEDIDGTRYIADGHQRRGLAERLVNQGFEDKSNVALDGFLFRAKDGWSSRDVRVVAALKNIREGSGTILDAAKVFREAPETIADRSLPVTGDFIQSARSLANLSDDAFGAVINKVIPERYGAEIGALAGDRPDLHEAMVKLMRDADPTSLDEARALVKEALLDDLIEADGVQADLFGNLPPQMTTIARAKIKAAVLKKLRSEARIFNLLNKQADIIEAGGNTLLRDANAQRLQTDLAAAELINRLSLRSGPIGEAFADAAKGVLQGKRAGDMAKDIVTKIRNAVETAETIDEMRGELINARAPATLDEVKPFDDIGGNGATDQIGDTVDEPQDELTFDLFGAAEDDAPLKMKTLDNALTHATTCAGVKP